MPAGIDLLFVAVTYSNSHLYNQEFIHYDLFTYIKYWHTYIIMETQSHFQCLHTIYLYTLYDTLNKKTSLIIIIYIHVAVRPSVLATAKRNNNNLNMPSTRTHDLTITPLQSTINSYWILSFLWTLFFCGTVCLLVYILSIKSINSFCPPLYHLHCSYLVQCFL